MTAITILLLMNPLKMVRVIAAVIDLTMYVDTDHFILFAENESNITSSVS